MPPNPLHEGHRVNLTWSILGLPPSSSASIPDPNNPIIGARILARLGPTDRRWKIAIDNDPRVYIVSSRKILAAIVEPPALPEANILRSRRQVDHGAFVSYEESDQEDVLWTLVILNTSYNILVGLHQV